MIRNLINKFKKILNSKFIWEKVKQCQIVIYDEEASEKIKSLFLSDSFFVLETRLKKINIPILIKSILKDNFKWKTQSYFDQYIIEINPSIIITLVDNNLNFWKLKDKFKNIKTIFIQNGNRDNFSDIFSKLTPLDFKKYSVDKMFVFNKAIGSEYSKYIKGEIIPIGSYYNNTFEVSKKEDDGSILYTSQWKKFIPEDYPMGYQFHINMDIKSEKYVFSAVSKFAKEKKIKLKVLGRSQYAKEEELFLKI